MEMIVHICLFLVLENARVNEISSDSHYMWLDWIPSFQNNQTFYFGSDHIRTPLHSGYNEMFKFETTLSSSWEAMAAEPWQEGWVTPGGAVRMNFGPIWQMQKL